MKSSILFTVILFALPAFAITPERYGLRTFRNPVVQSNGSVSIGRLLSNSVIDQKVDSLNGGIWLATGNGINFWHIADSVITSIPSGIKIGQGGVSALAPFHDTLWAATAYDENIDGTVYPAGGGIGWSYDGGETWRWQAQPVDSRDCTSYSPTTTNIQNLTYDLSVSSNAIWAASFGGGLRKGTLHRDTISTSPLVIRDSVHWRARPPDNNPFSALAYLNHRAFSVLAENDSVIWCGTAGGVNRSEDGGETWANFSYSPTDSFSLAGNFVVSLHLQRHANGTKTLWASTWKAEGASEEYGLTYTNDDGRTWHRTLIGEKIHNVTSDSIAVYAVGANGLFKSIDGGDTWGQFPAIRDADGRERFVEQELYSVASAMNRLSVGGPDGWATSRDGGGNWSIGRSFIPTTDPGQPAVYAYPNPFSPERFGAVRFQYFLPRSGEVSLTLYNFAMEKAGTILKKATRAQGDNTEIWSGRFDNATLANGVYFYKLEKPGGVAWGKLIILD